MGVPRSLAPAALARLLTRMQLSATVANDGAALLVEVPPTRPDVLHACDIWEDVAISYGFNNIKWTVPKVCTVGRPLPVNKVLPIPFHLHAFMSHLMSPSPYVSHIILYPPYI
jgi:phenylalanyl-tRNA synthetase beta chain